MTGPITATLSAAHIAARTAAVESAYLLALNVGILCAAALVFVAAGFVINSMRHDY
jgi:hypothetical protein